jgi:hypothetical protein
MDADNDFSKDDAGGTIFFFGGTLGLGEMESRVLGVVSGVGSGLGRWLAC